MSWSRAVWQEKTQEEEMTIPTVWIQDGYVRWPEGLQVLKPFNQQLTPKDDWHKFKLIKVKLCTGIDCNLIIVLSGETIHGVAYQQSFKRDFDIEKYLKSEVSSLRQFLLTESSLKLVKNAFYFTLKAVYNLKIFKFLS